MGSANVERIAAGFVELVRGVDLSLGFIERLLKNRRFLVLARNGEIMHGRPDGGQADEVLRIEPEQTKLKVSGLVRAMDEWKRRIASLPAPGFNILERRTEEHRDRTTFTGYPEAFDQHRDFLTEFVRSCVEDYP